MGFWGEGLYENDISLDIRDRIDADGYVYEIREEVREIIAEIKEEMDADEAPVAWLALADTLFDLGLLTESIKKNAIRASALIPADRLPSAEVVQKVVEKINGEQKKRAKKRAKRVVFPDWKDGDIFLFDLIGEYANDPFYEGWNIGFWKTNDVFYGPRTKNVNVYFFRTKYGLDDLQHDPSLIRNVQLIPILKGKWPFKPGQWQRGFWMRVTLFIESGYLPLERIHYCGNYDQFPNLPYEYPPFSMNYTGPCPRLFPLQCIEERLLWSVDYMDIVCETYL